MSTVISHPYFHSYRRNDDRRKKFIRKMQLSVLVLLGPKLATARHASQTSAKFSRFFNRKYRVFVNGNGKQLVLLHGFLNIFR